MSSIYVLGLEFSVEYVAPNDPRIDGNYGVTRYRDQSILVGDDIAPDLQAETLLHELIHCVDCSTCSNDHLKEDQVARISSGLFSVFRDKRNRGLIDELEGGNA